MSALYLNKAFIHVGLYYMLAVPPTVRVWLPEGSALTNGDDNAVKGAKSGDKENVEFL